jgi:hypothetical protein
VPKAATRSICSRRSYRGRGRVTDGDGALQPDGGRRPPRSASARGQRDARCRKERAPGSPPSHRCASFTLSGLCPQPTLLTPALVSNVEHGASRVRPDGSEATAEQRGVTRQSNSEDAKGARYEDFMVHQATTPEGPAAVPVLPRGNTRSNAGGTEEGPILQATESPTDREERVQSGAPSISRCTQRRILMHSPRDAESVHAWLACRATLKTRHLAPTARKL